MATLPTNLVVGSSGHVGHSNQAYEKLNLLCLDAVTDFDATGDDTADDTAELQAWLNASTSGAPKKLFLPPGVFKITDELTVPFSPGMKITGAGKRATTIKQYTAGKAIFRFDTADTHSVSVSDMMLGYDAPQTNSASIAVKWNAGIYFHKYERLQVRNAYRGFSTDGVATPWNNTFSDVQLFDIKNEAFHFSGAAGNPVNSLHLVSVINTGPAGVVSTGPCIDAVATSLVMNGLDIEGWYDKILNSNGGSVITIRGLHVESHKFDTALSYLMQHQNVGALEVDGFSIQGVTTANQSDVLAIAAGGDNAAIALRNGVIDVDTTLGAQYSASVVFGGAAKVYELDNVQLINVAHLTVPSADTTTLAKVVMHGIDAGGNGARIAFGGDTALYRAAANVLTTGSDDALKTGAAIHASLPAATGYAAGSQFYCTTDKQPLWSDGTNWVEADGTNH